MPTLIHSKASLKFGRVRMPTPAHRMTRTIPMNHQGRSISRRPTVSLPELGRRGVSTIEGAVGSGMLA